MSTFNPESIAFLAREPRIRIIEAFLKQLDEYPSEVRSYAAKGDRIQFSKSAHRLKGACLALQAETLAEVCLKAETTAGEKSTELGPLILELEKAIEETRRPVLAYYADLRSPE